METLIGKVPSVIQFVAASVGLRSASPRIVLATHTLYNKGRQRRAGNRAKASPVGAFLNSSGAKRAPLSTSSHIEQLLLLLSDIGQPCNWLCEYHGCL